MNRIVFLIVFFVSYYFITARPFRVDQIPNGSKNQCLNCHTSNLGGELNVFGQEVLSNHLTSKNSFGNVIWSSALASLDSDKDGFTNGQELLDPTGAWKVGTANPGKSSDVGNPGNPNIVPVSVKDLFSRYNDGLINIQQISPNPVKESFNLSLNISKSSYVNIELYDINGRKISSLYNGYLVDGNYNLVLNPEESSKTSLSDGNYLLLVSSNSSYDIQILKIAN